MGSKVIEVEGLAKAYQLGKIGTGTISRDLERFFITKILGKNDPFLKIGEINDRSVKGKSDIVWSLKDINFNVDKGDAVGIIGKNGAGKSTLLKLLSRVTSPTSGSIKLKGRVASLLEVGTGFHPELSGRENIYLNGAILGMRKSEIKRKFDEIVDFAGVERYIDTPVKRYSSGMYVRLAFAVAAHLESEILIVDEVLAVGDAEFQKKCIGKMGDISKGDGRTILFVSHNMAAVQQICEKGIVLKNGLINYYGEIENAVNEYSKGHREQKNISLSSYKNRKGNGVVMFEDFSIINKSNGALARVIVSGQDVTLRFKLKVKIEGCKIETLKFAIGINDSFENRIAHLNNEISGDNLNNADSGFTFVDFEIYRFPLNQGFYSLALMCEVNKEISDWIQLAVGFDVESGDYYNTGRLVDSTMGMFLMNYNVKIG